MPEEAKPSVDRALEKYKELYDLSLKVMEGGAERFRNIDEKSTKFFSVLTILLGAAGFLGEHVCEHLLPPKDCLECFLFVFASLLLLSLVVAWGFLFAVMTLRPLETIPMNDEMRKFWKDNKLLDIYHAIAVRNGQAHEKNVAVTNKKVRWLRAGYIATAISLGLLLLFSVLYVVHTWTTNPR